MNYFAITDKLDLEALLLLCLVELMNMKDCLKSSDDDHCSHWLTLSLWPRKCLHVFIPPALGMFLSPGNFSGVNRGCAPAGTDALRNERKLQQDCTIIAADSLPQWAFSDPTQEPVCWSSSKYSYLFVCWNELQQTECKMWSSVTCLAILMTCSPPCLCVVSEWNGLCLMQT